MINIIGKILNSILTRLLTRLLTSFFKNDEIFDEKKSIKKVGTKYPKSLDI